MESRFIGNRFIHKSSNGNFLFVKDAGKYHVFQNKCPHQNKPLDGCSVNDGHVICPYHKYGFALSDGRGQGLFLEKYQLKVEEGGVYVGIEKWSLF